MKSCLFCGKKFQPKPHAHNVKFCSITCRNKDLWLRVKDVRIEKQRAKSGAFADGKIQCKICGNWYFKPVAHVWQRHKMNEGEYKLEFDLPLSRGVINKEHKQILRENALINNMDRQLIRAGRLTRYKKGDIRARSVTGRKGRDGNKEYQFV